MYCSTVLLGLIFQGGLCTGKCSSTLLAFKNSPEISGLVVDGTIISGMVHLRVNERAQSTLALFIGSLLPSAVLVAVWACKLKNSAFLRTPFECQRLPVCWTEICPSQISVQLVFLPFFRQPWKVWYIILCFITCVCYIPLLSRNFATVFISLDSHAASIHRKRFRSWSTFLFQMFDCVLWQHRLSVPFPNVRSFKWSYLVSFWVHCFS